MTRRSAKNALLLSPTVMLTEDWRRAITMTFEIIVIIVNKSSNRGVYGGLAIESETMVLFATTENRQKGIKAFANERLSAFRGE
jgi:hypothetical protein